MNNTSFLGLNKEESKEAIEIIRNIDCNLFMTKEVINELYDIGEDWLAEHIGSNREEFTKWVKGVNNYI